MQVFKESCGLFYRDWVGGTDCAPGIYPCPVRQLRTPPCAYLLVTRTPKGINLSDVIPTEFIVDGEVPNAT